ncbi:hypothetical protein CC2G_008914 [Coprinopsis cinerea AmutBmut pab1-1]|nr:hypothetical protein CC2G_008914 [Coprinopsis cinerea AmutBmut pab1-1]
MMPPVALKPAQAIFTLLKSDFPHNKHLRCATPYVKPDPEAKTQSEEHRGDIFYFPYGSLFSAAFSSGDPPRSLIVAHLGTRTGMRAMCPRSQCPWNATLGVGWDLPSWTIRFRKADERLGMVFTEELSSLVNSMTSVFQARDRWNVTFVGIFGS